MPAKPYKKPTMGTCPLCRQHRKLCLSHFLPTGAYRWRQLGGALSASGRTLPGIEARTPSDQRERPGQKVASHRLWGNDQHALVVFGSRGAVTTVRQLKEYVLCEDCESAFCTKGEQYTLKHCFDRRSNSFPLWLLCSQPSLAFCHSAVESACRIRKLRHTDAVGPVRGKDQTIPQWQKLPWPTP